MVKTVVIKGVPVSFINEDDAVVRMDSSYDKPDAALDHDEFMAALAPYGLEGFGGLGLDLVGQPSQSPAPAVNVQPMPEKISVEIPRTSAAWTYGTIGGAALFLGAAVVFWMWMRKQD